jgi:hypothetical protein
MARLVSILTTGQYPTDDVVLSTDREAIENTLRDIESITSIPEIQAASGAAKGPGYLAMVGIVSDGIESLKFKTLLEYAEDVRKLLGESLEEALTALRLLLQDKTQAETMKRMILEEEVLQWVALKRKEFLNSIQDKLLKMAFPDETHALYTTSEQLDTLALEIMGDPPTGTIYVGAGNGVWTKEGWEAIRDNTGDRKVKLEIKEAAEIMKVLPSKSINRPLAQAFLNKLRTDYPVTLEEGAIELSHVIVQELIRD